MNQSLTLLHKTALQQKTFFATIGLLLVTLSVALAQDKPNLVPTAYQFSQWMSPIVVSALPSATTDSDVTSEDDIIVSWAVKNIGAAKTTSKFTSELRLDGKIVDSSLSTPPLDQNQYQIHFNVHLGKLPTGRHSLRLTADSDGAIPESKEDDNTFEKPFTVLPPLNPSLITLQDSPISFGDVQLGASSEATFVIQHVATSKAASGIVRIAGEGFELIDSPGFKIERGGAASFHVRFNPSAVRGYSGYISVDTSSSFSGVSSIALSGNGILAPPSTGSIQVRGSQNGTDWHGSYKYSLVGPVTIHADTLPADFQNVPVGVYSIVTASPMPVSLYVAKVLPSASQSITPGTQISYTILFSSLPAMEFASQSFGSDGGVIKLQTRLASDLKALIHFSSSITKPNWLLHSETVLSAGSQQINLPIDDQFPYRIYRIRMQNPLGRLSFPLRPGSPYTNEVSAVFDHSEPTGCSNGIVVAYTGEVGLASYGLSDWSTPGESNDCTKDTLYGFPNEKDLSRRTSFLNVINYTGGDSIAPQLFLYYDGHTGYDYPVHDGTDVYAAASGTVLEVSPDPTNPKLFQVVLSHSGGYTTHYLHLTTASVSAKDPVTEEETKIGKTGNGHLHFTVRENGIRVDPYGWFGSSPDPHPRDGVPGHDNITLWRALK